MTLAKLLNFDEQIKRQKKNSWNLCTNEVLRKEKSLYTVMAERI